MAVATSVSANFFDWGPAGPPGSLIGGPAGPLNAAFGGRRAPPLDSLGAQNVQEYAWNKSVKLLFFKKKKIEKKRKEIALSNFEFFHENILDNVA